MQKVHDHTTIADKSSGSLDPDFISKGRPDTTRHIKPAQFVVPELPWKKTIHYNGNLLSDKQQQAESLRPPGLSRDADQGNLGTSLPPTDE